MDTDIEKQKPSKQLEDIEIEEDPTYDRDLNWNNPIKLLMQKWILKRNKSVRYQTEDKEFEGFDDRRLVDSRFFLFMGVISNSMF